MGSLDHSKPSPRGTVSATENVEKLEPLFIAGGGVKWSSPCARQCNMALPCDPAILLLGVHPKELKAEPKPVFAHACSQQHYSEQPKHGNLTINREKEKQNVFYTHNSAFTREEMTPQQG